MKRMLLASVGLAVIAATSAFASDVRERSLPVPRASAYVPFFTWNGFYLGINAGYGFGQSNWTNQTTGATTGDFNVSGGLIGGTAGYNVQLGSVVVGAEADLGWSNIKGSSTTGCAGACETTNNWLGTARGRIGPALDRFLPYVTAGAAFGHIKGTFAGSSFTETKVGFSAGAGIEYAFLHNWSAKVEYLYADLGKATCDAACSGGTPFDVKFSTNIIRAGLNYKF